MLTFILDPDGIAPYPPPLPTVGWEMGWGSHTLLLTFILGLQQNTAFGSTAQCRRAANRDMVASKHVFPSISFDFLKKTKETACQARLSNWRGIPYVGAGGPAILVAGTEMDS